MKRPKSLNLLTDKATKTYRLHLQRDVIDQKSIFEFSQPINYMPEFTFKSTIIFVLLVLSASSSYSSSLTVRYKSQLEPGKYDTACIATLWCNDFDQFDEWQKKTAITAFRTFQFELSSPDDVVVRFFLQYGKVNESFEVYMQPGKSVQIDVDPSVTDESDSAFYEKRYQYSGNLAKLNFRLNQFGKQINKLRQGNNIFPSSWDRMDDSLEYSILKSLQDRWQEKEEKIREICKNMGEEKTLFYNYVCDRTLLELGTVRIQHFMHANRKQRMDSSVYYEVINMFCVLKTGNYHLPEFKEFARHVNLFRSDIAMSDSLFLQELRKEPIMEELKVRMILTRYFNSFFSTDRYTNTPSRKRTYEPKTTDQLFKEALIKNNSAYAKFILKNDVLNQLKIFCEAECAKMSRGK